MPGGYRLSDEIYLPTFWSSVGSEKHGGRWNEPGAGLIYTSDALALAVLELLAHLGDLRLIANHHIFAEIQFADQMVMEVETWAGESTPTSLDMGVTQKLGSQWIASEDSVVLSVPSIVIPRGRNYLLNPRHPDYPAVIQGDPEPFQLDQRLV